MYSADTFLLYRLRKYEYHIIKSKVRTINLPDDFSVNWIHVECFLQNIGDLVPTWTFICIVNVKRTVALSPRVVGDNPPWNMHMYPVNPGILFYYAGRHFIVRFRNVLTNWGQDKMAPIAQMIHSNAFSWMNVLEFRLKCHWSLFLRAQLIFQHWTAPSHYLNLWWLVYPRIYAWLGLNELTRESHLLCRQAFHSAIS